jgi:hypothetical protein
MLKCGLVCHFDNQQQATLLTFRLVSVQAIQDGNETDEVKTRLIEEMRNGVSILDRPGAPSAREVALNIGNGQSYRDGDGNLISALLPHNGQLYTLRVRQMCMMCWSMF